MSTTTALPAGFDAAPKPADFTALVDLLAVLGTAQRSLDGLQRQIDDNLADMVDTVRPDYAATQQKVGETEAAIEVIVRRNPQWFGEKKSVTTPYGVVKFKASTVLECADEEEVVRRLLKTRRVRFLRRTIELNRDLLAELADEDLAALGIVRKPKENLTIETKVIDLGKAVKAADKTPRNAAKTAKAAAVAAEGRG